VAASGLTFYWAHYREEYALVAMEVKTQEMMRELRDISVKFADTQKKAQHLSLLSVFIIVALFRRQEGHRGGAWPEK
jgi:hypothetical protein